MNPIHSTMLGLAGVLCASIALLGCDTGEEREVPEWPTGTVVVIEGTPITAAEVDHYLDAIGAIGPAFSVTHRRRTALTSILFPLAYGRIEGADRREAARAQAEAWNLERKNGQLQGPFEAPLRGTWEEIGLEVWVSVRELEPGEWTEVCELSGQYAVVQLAWRSDSAHASLENFEVQLKTFPYVENPGELLVQYLQAKLEIVDPEWDEVVPGYWKYKMRGDS